MTDIKKLAAKHARGAHDEVRTKNAIILALKEYQKSVVIDVLHSDPSTALLAERIVRTRPIPYGGTTAYGGQHARNRITFKSLVEYAVEMGRELERRSHPEAELEYGWQWVSNPVSVARIFGAKDRASAGRAMESFEKLVAPVQIMVRTKAVPGEWREA